MRKLILTLALAAATVACAAPSHPAEEPRPERSKVTLELEGVPLKTAIRRFFEGEGLKREAFTPTFPPQCTIDPNVPDVPITLRLRGVGWVHALWLLVGAAWEQNVRMSISRGGDIYVIKVRQAAEGEVSPAEYVRKARAETLNVDVERKPLREAVWELFPRRMARVRVDADVAEVPVSLKVPEITAEAAVARLAQAADREMPGVTYTRAGHYFVLHRSVPH